MPFFTRSALLPQLAQLGIRLDKQKGQCYLIDQNLANFIIAEAELNPEIDTVLEIGPGLGTLSDFLAAKSRQLFLIEYDKKMVHFLAENFQLQYESVLINPDMQSIPSEARIILYQGDALEIPFPSVLKIVANIPYQISGPLFIKIIANWQYQFVLLMVQKEFADHLQAAVNSEDYTRIAAATQLYLDIKRLRVVPSSCFYPEPKVNSVILKITLKPELTPDSPEFQYCTQYLELLRGTFPYKNKVLRKALMFYRDADPLALEFFPMLQELINDPKYTSVKVRTLTPFQLFKLTLYAIQGFTALSSGEV